MKERNEGQIRLYVAVIAIVTTVIIVGGYFLIRAIMNERVDLPGYMVPHLVMAGLFPPPYISKPKNKHQRRPHEQVTRRLFWAIIIIVSLLGLFGFLLSTAFSMVG